ncbi:MAG: hypothetical protein Q9227_001909 [Pyrenula ochraceoflavens]
MEALQTKHRKEQRDLQSQITQKKKSATKKTRKSVNDECDRLQRELAEKHHQQLEEINKPHNENDDAPRSMKEDVNGCIPLSDGSTRENGAEKTKEPTSQEQFPDSNPLVPAQSKKPNRQKARMARRAAEKEALMAEAEREAANAPDIRKQEREAMEERFKALELKETEVRPDGHCMYSAIAHRLSPDRDELEDPSTTNGASKETYQTVRVTAANFVAQHPSDFAPFLEEPLETYVSKIRDTAEWGGQLELQAISRAYEVEINVLQATGDVVKIRPPSSTVNKTIWLAYYRHSFGLGEHYNALEKR